MRILERDLYAVSAFVSDIIIVFKKKKKLIAFALEEQRRLGII